MSVWGLPRTRMSACEGRSERVTQGMTARTTMQTESNPAPHTPHSTHDDGDFGVAIKRIFTRIYLKPIT